MSEAVKTVGLRRSFGPRVAVDNLDLVVERGDVFGLLGPNGAGKTTTIRMLTTLLAPSSGNAQVCGYDISEQARDVRRSIGYVMQEVPWQVNRQLTAREILEIEAALHHVPAKEIRQRVTDVLELIDLTPHADREIDEFSGGMHKRLDLASGLIHRPQVLILDEPTLGLDVQSRHKVWEYIKELRDEGVTVLLATNYLDEADRLCNRITIIDNGRAVITGSPSELKRAVAADVIEISTKDTERLREAIAGEPWVTKIVIGDSDDIHVYVEEASIALPAIMRLTLDRGLSLDRVTYSQPTLDDVFLLHTGRELRELEMSI